MAVLKLLQLLDQRGWYAEFDDHQSRLLCLNAAIRIGMTIGTRIIGFR